MTKTITMIKVEEFEEKLKKFEEEREATDKAHQRELNELYMSFTTALNELGKQLTNLTNVVEAAAEDRRKRLEQARKQLKSE